MITINFYKTGTKELIAAIPLTEMVYKPDVGFLLPEHVVAKLSSDFHSYSYSVGSKSQGWETAKFFTAQIPRNWKIGNLSEWGTALHEIVQGKPYAVQEPKDMVLACGSVFRLNKADLPGREDTSRTVREFRSYDWEFPKEGSGTVRPFSDIVNASYLRIRYLDDLSTHELAEADLYALADDRLADSKLLTAASGKKHILEAWDKHKGVWTGVSWGVANPYRTSVLNCLHHITSVRLNIAELDKGNAVTQTAAEIVDTHFRKLGLPYRIGPDGGAPIVMRMLGPLSSMRKELEANAKPPLSAPATPPTDSVPRQTKPPTGWDAVLSDGYSRQALAPGIHVDVAQPLPSGKPVEELTYASASLASSKLTEAIISCPPDPQPISGQPVQLPDSTQMNETFIFNVDSNTPAPEYALVYSQPGNNTFWLPAKATIYEGNVEFVSVNPFECEDGVFNEDNVTDDHPVQIFAVNLATGQRVGPSKFIREYDDIWEHVADVQVTSNRPMVDNAVFTFRVDGAPLPMGAARTDYNTDVDLRWVNDLLRETVATRCEQALGVQDKPLVRVEGWIPQYHPILYRDRLAVTGDPPAGPAHAAHALTPPKGGLDCVTERVMCLLGQDSENNKTVIVRYIELPSAIAETQNTMASNDPTPVAQNANLPPALPEPAGMSVFGAIANVIGKGVISGAQAGGALALAAGTTALATHGAKSLGVSKRVLNKPYMKALMAIAPIAGATVVAGFIPGIKDNKAVMAGLLMGCGAAATKLSQGIIGNVLGTVGQFAELAAGIGQEALPESEPEVAGKATQVVE